MALNVSQNASEWMPKKGYVVNGAAHTKYYEGVTPPCESGDGGCFFVRVSNACGARELLVGPALLCDVNRSLLHGFCLTAQSPHVRGVCVCAVVGFLVGH